MVKWYHAPAQCHLHTHVLTTLPVASVCNMSECLPALDARYSLVKVLLADDPYPMHENPGALCCTDGHVVSGTSSGSSGKYLYDSPSVAYPTFANGLTRLRIRTVASAGQIVCPM